MKVLKTVAIVILAVLLAATLIIFNVSMAATNVLLKPSTYTKVIAGIDPADVVHELEEKVKKENVGDAEKQAEGDITESGEPDLGKILASAVDKKWLEKNLGLMVEGIFAFLDGRAKTLPILDLSEVRNKAIEFIPDKVDLNDMFNKFTGGQSEVAAGYLRTLFRAVKNMPVLALLIVIMLAIAISVTVIYPKTILRSIGLAIMGGGIIALTGSVIGFAIFTPYTGIEGQVINGVLKQVCEKSLVIAGVLTIIGVVLLWAGFRRRILHLSEIVGERMHQGQRYKGILGGRVLLATVVMVLIPVTIYIYSSPVIKTVETIRAKSKVQKVLGSP